MPNLAAFKTALPTQASGVLFTKLIYDWMKIVDFFIDNPFLGKGTFFVYQSLHDKQQIIRKLINKLDF